MRVPTSTFFACNAAAKRENAAHLPRASSATLHHHHDDNTCRFFLSLSLSLSTLTSTSNSIVKPRRRNPSSSAKVNKGSRQKEECSHEIHLPSATNNTNKQTKRNENKKQKMKTDLQNTRTHTRKHARFTKKTFTYNSNAHAATQ